MAVEFLFELASQFQRDVLFEKPGFEVSRVQTMAGVMEDGDELMKVDAIEGIAGSHSVWRHGHRSIGDIARRLGALSGRCRCPGRQ